MVGKVYGIGSYAPSKVLDNYDLAKLVDTNDEWIRERTGIARRHIVEEDTTVSMSVEASKRALQQANMQAEELDLILVSTISSNVILPCAACEVQAEIGATNAVAFDINLACSGFVAAYATAQAYIVSGMYRKVLIIGSEALSTLTNWTDRGTCILFGDGAGAVVMKAEEGTVYQSVLHSDGSIGGALTCKSRHDLAVDKALFAEGAQEPWKMPEDTYMQMEGQAVFKFAVKKVPEVIQEVLDKNQVNIEEIDWFVLHQANKRIIDSIAKRLQVPIAKMPTNVEEYGNTSSASIPLLLDELNREGKLKKGQKIVLAGFGAGLSWGAAILEF
jgi:3-oxoacyl-(acyl-carrier-protein) synthase III